MGRLATLFNSVANSWSGTGNAYYDSLKDTGRRRPLPPSKIKHADRKLGDRDRRTMSARAGEVADNFSLAAWMVRQHLDYIAAVTFRPDTKNDELNLQLAAFMADWSLRQRCHTQRRYCLAKLIRVIEERRVIDGDVFLMKVAGDTDSRGSLQIIEADRVLTPSPTSWSGAAANNEERWYNGVQVSEAGIPTAYAIHKRLDDGSLVFERMVPAENLLHHGFFNRADQYRGISPFVQGLNVLQDVYEGFDYSLSKVKLSQIFSAFITRDGNAPLGAVPTSDANADGLNDSNYVFDLTGGPKVFDLGVGEGVQMISGAGDSTDAINLLKMMTQVALKSLDLPMAFFSEDFTNWFGSRASEIHFERSAKPKRAELIEVLDEMTQWRLSMAVADGEIVLPAGTTIKDLNWAWIPEVTDWFDPHKESVGYRSLIGAGLASPIDILKSKGRDWEQTLADRATFEQRAKELGIALDFSMGSSSSTAVAAPAAEEADEMPEEPEEPSDEN